MKVKKCKRCLKEYEINLFIKNGEEFKSCQHCRDYTEDRSRRIKDKYNDYTICINDDCEDRVYIKKSKICNKCIDKYNGVKYCIRCLKTEVEFTKSGNICKDCIRSEYYKKRGKSANKKIVKSDEEIGLQDRINKINNEKGYGYTFFSENRYQLALERPFMKDLKIDVRKFIENIKKNDNYLDLSNINDIITLYQYIYLRIDALLRRDKKSGEELKVMYDKIYDFYKKEC